MPPTAQDFQNELTAILQAAQRQGLPYVDVKSGDLHRRVGGYPGPNHRMPVCCEVMKHNMGPNDKILHQPSKGKGATLIIRYMLTSKKTQNTVQTKSNSLSPREVHPDKDLKSNDLHREITGRQFNRYVVRREKRLLNVPYEIAKNPNLREIYFNAIRKSLPDVLVMAPEFFEDKKD